LINAGSNPLKPGSSTGAEDLPHTASSNRRDTPLENEKKTRRWTGHIEHWQIVAVALAVYDFIAICVSYFLALWLRFHSCKFGTMKKCLNVG
jgi:hypothetical protein